MNEQYSEWKSIKNIKMFSDDFDPDVCLKRLHEIVEEIPSGVRDDTFASILAVEDSRELFATTNANIISYVNQFIDALWVEFSVAEKMLHLKRLEEHSLKEKAWRPVTGEMDTKPIHMNVLKERKDRLEEAIRLTKEESEALKYQLKQYKDKLNTQMADMDNFCSSVDEDSNENSVTDAVEQ